MSLMNKVLATGLALALNGCQFTPQKDAHDHFITTTSTLTENKIIPSPPKNNKNISTEENYIICSATDMRYEWDRYCFQNNEIYFLQELGLNSTEANKLLPLHSVTIRLLKEKGCDLSKYSSLREKLGNDEELRYYNGNLAQILCSQKIKVDVVDTIVSKYPSSFKKWEAVILYDAGIDEQKAQQYLNLRNEFNNLNIPVQAMVGFDVDIVSGKTTYSEIKKLLRNKELLRNIK